eukprot:TRINITY_DN9399_c0_g1_i1.p1 TRINITY_DN9399_c0_g1~~TRINITY_DN9399_c0_g1_i1.p1  ORF type:complete len:717 (+),score=158.84 TRINITY_DN9399_c0_g1_i1:58-2208(+)
MSLLPKTREDFRLSSYWDQFFQQRGDQQPFEWYGSYRELRSIFRAYTKQDQSILVLGCGNSSSSADMFQDGYKTIVNVDFSQKVLDQMKTRYAKMKSMTWENMDMRELRKPDESFGVVFDKGGLDALVADETPEIRADAIRMLSEVHRVLKPSGVYFCVTIAQEYVFRLLLTFFAEMGYGYFVSIHAVPRLPSENESPLVSFAVAFIKPSGKTEAITFQTTFDGHTASYGSDIDAVISAVKGYQMGAFSMKNIRQYKAGRVSELSLSINTTAAESSITAPKYTLTVVDSKQPGSAGLTAAFLVPQGREREFMFSKEEGLLQLSETAGFTRLVVVHFSPYHKFNNIEQVQKELSPYIMELSLKPDSLGGKSKGKQLPPPQIPFLTAAEGIGKREVVRKGNSSLSGAYRVEDVQEDGETLRRLIFDASPNVVQTEARIPIKASAQSRPATAGKKKKGGKSSDQLPVSAEATPAPAESKTSAPVIDVGYLPFEYHQGMIVAMTLAAPVFAAGVTGASCLIIGLGGGMLPLFLRHSFPNLSVDCVELDPEVVSIAKDCYGLVEDARLQVNIADGLEFVKHKTGVYDIVIVDVDSKDISEGLSCPPESFVRPDFLASVKVAMKDQGLFLLNLSCRAEGIRTAALSSVASCFAEGYQLPVEAMVNVIVCALKSPRHATLGKGDAEIIRSAKSSAITWNPDIEFIKWMIKFKKLSRPKADSTS